MENDENDFASMTVNERLFVRGLLTEFDLAIRSQDRNKVRKILRAVKVDEISIDRIIVEFGSDKF